MHRVGRCRLGPKQGNAECDGPAEGTAPAVVSHARVLRLRLVRGSRRVQILYGNYKRHAIQGDMLSGPNVGGGLHFFGAAVCRDGLSRFSNIFHMTRLRSKLQMHHRHATR